MQVKNGMPACELPKVRWRKSQASNPSGSCVEIAELPGGAIAVRNSRHPSGPALVYTRAEVAAFLTGVKDGEFDDLYPGGSAALSSSHCLRMLAECIREWLIWRVSKLRTAGTFSVPGGRRHALSGQIREPG